MNGKPTSDTPARKSGLKSMLVAPLRELLRASAKLSEYIRRIYSHASLAAHLKTPLPASVVVLGRAIVYGTGQVHFGRDILLYPDLHLETQGPASITIGDVKCAFGVEARAASYSSGLRIWRTSRAVSCQSLRG